MPFLPELKLAIFLPDTSKDRSTAAITAIANPPASQIHAY